MEALERRSKMLAIGAIVFIVFWSQCTGVEGRNSTRMSYVCPPQFLRLGYSCYFFSDANATWHNALYACKDRDSSLSVPARWEDRNLRNHLKTTSDKISRWIGGIYDYGAQAWKWGGELKEMHYQSFSKMKRLSPDELQWHCIAMMPELLYRWAPRSCIEARPYICQTKLLKLPKSQVNELKRRYRGMGKLNEITVPSISKEVVDPRINEVTTNPVDNPKSYDLRPSSLRLKPKPKGVRNMKHGVRPNELRKRSRPTARRRLTRPFPGYQWNRRDPEGSFKLNAELLRSGRTGLSPQQVKAHLARLAHMRDKQINRRRTLARRRSSHSRDWLTNDNRPALAQTHARTYVMDNNISELHPKTIVEEFDMMPPAKIAAQG